MPSYVAFLGSHPHLSVSELSAVFPDFAITQRCATHALRFTTDAVIDQSLLDTLGGVFIIGQEVKNQATASEIPSLLVRETAAVKGKVTFSLRAYGVDRMVVRNLYRQCKEALVRGGKAVRYIGSESKPPVSGQLHDSGLIGSKHGCELILIADGERLWIGRTIAAQNPRAYTVRDMEKPVRDKRSGFMPPKLAQVLLNLALFAVRSVRPEVMTKTKHPTLTVYDPFCGIGVIPMEAVLRQWPVFASDLSSKAMTGADENLTWLRKLTKITKSDVPSILWRQDARKPLPFPEGKVPYRVHPDVIVTETSLGTNYMSAPPKAEALKDRTACEDLEEAFLRNIKHSLPECPVVLCLPVWHLKSEVLVLERFWKRLASIGYRAILPPHIAALHGRPTLHYHHQDQVVGREIVVLIPA